MEMEWGNKEELRNDNSFKNNINYDLLKTYKDPHDRFFFLEIEVKNSFLTIANIYGPNVDNPDFF